MEINDITVLLSIIGGLTVLTNLITEVLKPITQIRIPSEATATAVAELLTMAAFFGYMDILHHPVHWYSIAGAFVCGLLVSYAAQFGFDKLKSALASVKGESK